MGAESVLFPSVDPPGWTLQQFHFLSLFSISKRGKRAARTRLWPYFLRGKVQAFGCSADGWLARGSVSLLISASVPHSLDTELLETLRAVSLHRLTPTSSKQEVQKTPKLPAAVPWALSRHPVPKHLLPQVPLKGYLLFQEVPDMLKHLWVEEIPGLRALGHGWSVVTLLPREVAWSFYKP